MRWLPAPSASDDGLQRDFEVPPQSLPDHGGISIDSDRDKDDTQKNSYTEIEMQML